MTTPIITVSNGQEFYRIPVTDLDEARHDGFYVPGEKDRTIVSDGSEVFEVPLPDVPEAEKDGFRDLLASERGSVLPEVVAEPVPESAAAFGTDAEENPVTASDESAGDGVEAELGLEDDLEAVVSDNRRQLFGVVGFSTAVHAAAILVLLSIIIPLEMEDRVEILSVLPTIDQDSAEFAEVELVQPEKIEQDASSEVIQDLITDNDEVIEIDINDLEISSAIPEKTKGAGNPVAKITGELGGRSQAGKSALVARFGGNAASEAAVRGGLDWLSRHQNEDGSWSYDHVHADCQGECLQAGSLKRSHMGATAMALLAMLGAGETHFVGSYRRKVYKGFDYLLSNAKPTPYGLDLRGVGEGNTGMYIQGLATMALCEAAVMSAIALKQRPRSRRNKKAEAERVDRKVATSSLKRLREASQLALNFIMYAQNPKTGGWQYQPQQGGDTSVLGWQVMALKSGQLAGLKILPETVRRASFFLDSVQVEEGAAYGYTSPQRKNSTTAVGLLSRMYMGWSRKNPALGAGVKSLSAVGPSRNDMYYNYYATQVLHHWGGDEWKKWNSVMRKQLVDSQRKKGHAAGSWNVADTHGAGGGRLYMTCLCTMTLEVYYRHMPLYEQAGQIKTPMTKKTPKRSAKKSGGTR